MMRILPLALLAVSLLTAPLAAAGYVSTQPVERQDYWQKRQATIEKTLADSPDLSGVRLVFLGDSITDFWLLGENPWMRDVRNGRAIWDESFTAGANKALNLGVSGDRIEHVLFRLQPRAQGGRGQLDRADLNPDFIVLMLGINNSYEVETPAADSIYQGVKAVVEAVRARKPGSRLVLQSLLPTSDEVKNRDIVAPVNARLKALAAADPRHILWLDLATPFTTPEGRQRSELFYDGLHPNEAGYRLWRDRLVPLLDEARQAPPR
jgi:lysophospholipase L1-like esterase